MINLAFKLRLAKQKGEQVAEQQGFASLAINPIAIAERCGIVVQPKPDKQPGVSGMLMYQGNTFGIMYTRYIDNKGFQNFCIAHELGHYFLDGHFEKLVKDTGIHYSLAGYASRDDYEREADAFASGLLMPEKLCRREISRLGEGLAAIKRLGELCETSLTATALRYTELAREAVAIVVSTGDKVDFCAMSDLLKSVDGLTWLKSGSAIPKSAKTLQFNRSPEKVRAAAEDIEETDISIWFGGNREIPALEEIIGLGDYGRTLTVITSRNIDDPTYFDPTSDDQDDEALLESWTPLFKK